MSNLVKNYRFVLDLAKFKKSVKHLYDVIEACAAKRAPVSYTHLTLPTTPYV